MFDIDTFEVNKVKEDDNYGEFEIGPLPKGFGHTIGNTLRRILLSAIAGSAVTSVKLNNVEHEYTALEGLQDDVLSILLKLKELAVISHIDDEVVLKLNLKGQKGKSIDVTAADIDSNPDVEIINKDLHITTLTDAKGRIDAEIRIKKGVSYMLPDESMRKEIGNLPVDANFNPVIRVEVQIVPARVGQRTDYEQIILKVTTNKTKSPSEVLLEAVELYDKIANKLVNNLGGDAKELEAQVVTEAQEVKEDKILISEVNMSTRLTNSLLNSGIATLNELDGMSIEEVMNFRGMGKKSYEELNEVLSDFGFSLKK